MHTLANIIEKHNVDPTTATLNVRVRYMQTMMGNALVIEPHLRFVSIVEGDATIEIDNPDLTEAIFDTVLFYHHDAVRSRSLISNQPVVVTPDATVSFPLDLMLRRMEAQNALDRATHDHSDGSEERFNDARWAVFSNTDDFFANPCDRATFDHLSAEKERLDDRGSFREFYAAWNDASTTSVVDGKLIHSTKDLVLKTVELCNDTGSDFNEIRDVVYGSFKVHPLHREVYDVVIADRLGELGAMPTKLGI